MKIIQTLCALAIISVAGVAQERQPLPSSLYDASKEATYNVKVSGIEINEQMGFLALIATIDGKEYRVAVGHVDAIKAKSFSFAKDDELTITGVKSDRADRSAPGRLLFHCREIKKGEAILVSIDKNGAPQLMRPR